MIWFYQNCSIFIKYICLYGSIKIKFYINVVYIYWFICMLTCDIIIELNGMTRASRAPDPTRYHSRGPFFVLWGQSPQDVTTCYHFNTGVIYFINKYIIYPIRSMYAIYGNIYHPYTPNVSIYTIHGPYGYIYI